MSLNYSSADILLTAGDILIAPLATALPSNTTVAYGAYASWVNWKHLGYTSVPLRITASSDLIELFVEQSTSPLKQKKDNERYVIDFSLSQFSDENLAILMAGTVTSTIAGPAQKALDKIAFGGSPNLVEYMLAIEGFRSDINNVSQPVRIFFYRGTIRLGGAVEFNKAGATVLPGQFTAQADSSKAKGIQIGEVQIITSAVT